MQNWNLSRWALAHRNFVLYLMVLTMVMGIWGYNQLGQSEDPPFTFKVMLVQVQWPGATAQDIEEQVVDRVEKVIMETPHVDTVKSFSMPEKANILVIVDDSIPAEGVPEIFYQVRKRVGDIAMRLPQGVLGPFFNDEFGDTYGNVFALTGDGFDLAQLRDTADDIRKELLRVPNVSKVLLLGEQAERVYIEIDNQKLANLGFSLAQLQNTLAQQNIMGSAGFIDTASDRIYFRPTGRFQSVEAVRQLPIQIGDTTLRLDEVAQVKRGYIEPEAVVVRFMGQQGLGIGVAMQAGGDIIQLGKDLDEAFKRIQNRLPVGMELSRVNDQPRAVKSSIQEFLKVVAEAVIIVLVVSFFSLGMRAGTVVALSIPLVLAGTFFTMSAFDIGLHKISLGALILALGLLVDDAIIAVEMMALKLEEGWDRVRAASFAYQTTAFPMLTGTLVTAAGFLPIATAASATGEYTRAIFQVVVIALVISWIAAVIVVPYLGYYLIKEEKHDPEQEEKPQGFVGRLVDGFYSGFRKLVTFCMNFPILVIFLTSLVFAGSMYMFQFVQQQFFPSSTRLELLVDLKLPEGASRRAIQEEVNKMEQHLEQDKERIENYISYVGAGAPRFYLPLDQQLENQSFAQFVITTNNIEDREALRAKLIALVDGAEFSHLRGRVLRLESGPPIGYPVQFRVSGDDLWTLRQLAEQVATKMRENPHLRNVNYDWNERSKTIQLDVNYEKAVALGVTQNAINQAVSGYLQGMPLGEFRENDQTIPIVLRGGSLSEQSLDVVANLNVSTNTGGSITLSEIAQFKSVQEDPLIWHRNRTPTITIRGDIYSSIQAPTVTTQVLKELAEFKDNLPLGYRLEVGGSVEESAKGEASIAKGMPFFVVVVLTLLMIQLQSFQRVIMVVLTAPFGLIGVVAFLLLFNQPFGFVAMLGTIALSGMIMRNSLILVDQIDRNIEEGMIPKQAIIEAAVRRFRPIMLTALAAILAMVPLSESVFFGPMAIAIMGGLFIATILTLLLLPAMYAVWYKITHGREAFLAKPEMAHS